MRRHILLSAVLVAQLSWFAASVPAQDAAASNSHQEAEENLKILNSRIEDLTAANEALKKKVDKLGEELQRLADEVSRATDRSKDTATLESLKQLKHAIEEVDKKRLDDQKLVLGQLESLKKILEKPLPKSNPVTTPGPKPNNSKPPAPETNHDPEKAFKYSIRDGDTLLGIVAALKKQGVKTSMKEIMDANPSVNWKKLYINQVIFIPAPAQ